MVEFILKLKLPTGEILGIASFYKKAQSFNKILIFKFLP